MADGSVPDGSAPAAPAPRRWPRQGEAGGGGGGGCRTPGGGGCGVLGRGGGGVPASLVGGGAAAPEGAQVAGGLTSRDRGLLGGWGPGAAPPPVRLGSLAR